MKMHTIIAAASALLVFSQALLPADKSPKKTAEDAELLKTFVPAKLRQDAPKWAVDYFARVDKERLGICQNCLEVLSQEKTAISNAKRIRGDKKAKDEAVAKEKEKADKARELLRVTLKDARSAVPDMEHISLYDLPKVGDTGRIRLMDVKQVVGVEKALMVADVGLPRTSPRIERGYLFILKGVSTKDWVDGSGKELSSPLRVTGTETYETASGTKTVHVLEPFDPEDFLDDDVARANADAKRNGQLKERK